MITFNLKTFCLPQFFVVVCLCFEYSEKQLVEKADKIAPFGFHEIQQAWVYLGVKPAKLTSDVKQRNQNINNKTECKTSVGRNR